MKFRVTYEDEIEADTEEQAYELLIRHLDNVVLFRDVTEFEFTQVVSEKPCY